MSGSARVPVLELLREQQRGLQYAMGPDRGPAWTARLSGHEATTILADESVLSTQGFPRVLRSEA